MIPPETNDPAPATADYPAEPSHGPLWPRLWDGLFPLSVFTLVTLALYWAAMRDAPRGDQVVLWEIFRNLEWRWSAPGEILFIDLGNEPRFQPLMFFLQFLQAKLFGQAFWAYHLLSVLLHGLNAFLLFRIARALDCDWLPSFAVALLFLTAFTHLDLVAWPFHFYILLQVTLALLSVFLLIRRDRVSWSLVWAYGVAWAQIYLYEPGILLPLLLFAIDVGRRFRRPGWILRLSASLLLACGATAAYLATALWFFGSMEAALAAGDPGSLTGASNLLRAFAGPGLLLLDSAFLHNLFSAPKFIVDEAFFLAPPRLDSLAFDASILHGLVVGCCGLLALAFLAALRRVNAQETETLAAEETSAVATGESLADRAGETRVRAYAVATLASGIAGFALVFYRLPWAGGPSVFQALFVIWLPVALLAALTIRSPDRAAALIRGLAARWPARVDPLCLGLVLLLALVLVFLAPRGQVGALADDGARLLLEPWDFAAILLAPAMILMGQRPRGGGLAWLLFVLVAVTAYGGVIALGRPVIYLISQSRYAYVPTLGLAVAALLVFAPVLARRPAADRRWLSLLALRKHALLAGLILFISLNALKVVDGFEQTMAYRAETNRIIDETRRFLDDRVQSGDRLFIAQSSYPDHERLARGSGILPWVLFGDDERVTQNLQTATHVLGAEGRAASTAGLLSAGADSFVLRVGVILADTPPAAGTLEIFTPPGGCAEAGWYLDFVLDPSQPASEDSQLGSGRLVFGRCQGVEKTALFESGPVTVERDRLNLFEFGRAQGHYYLIHNGVLAEKIPAMDPIDLSAMDFELGAAYRTAAKVALTHSFVGVGYRDRNIAEVEIGERYPDPPYHPFGLRRYARTLR